MLVCLLIIRIFAIQKHLVMSIVSYIIVAIFAFVVLYLSIGILSWGFKYNPDEPIIKTEITFGSKDDEDDKKN